MFLVARNILFKTIFGKSTCMTRAVCYYIGTDKSLEIQQEECDVVDIISAKSSLKLIENLDLEDISVKFNDGMIFFYQKIIRYCLDLEQGFQQVFQIDSTREDQKGYCWQEVEEYS
ncbi:hypothetical protein DFA_09422 [Cavenderia fasciculata]|uniref:Uncharacterized protein n=1 Tax=Cavenderia fasciculata TaxID=261658 RepID=F4Q7K8_CACFS|nr:uncharacterized protein DFA_09422 [Cavenderia fasciculata]EGG16390.1 hypothetical protein DFA_09422 [Cavenderia fasciculata]|eukprot:XP_004354774.1 hypothetical protein DFA_09422 [Cavenderia fasciculata]